MDFDDAITVVVFGFIGLMLLIILTMLFVVLPVTLLAEAECFEKGYPKAMVTWKLDRYCANLEGSVTVRVDRIGQ